MKTTLLIAILSCGLLPVLTPKAEAQHCGQTSQVFVSGYTRCGTPIYMVRYIAGYDRCGRAVWRTRNLYQSERNRYYRSSQRIQPRYSGYRGYAGYGQSRITYSSSGGRYYSYSYNSGYPSRCRSW